MKYKISFSVTDTYPQLEVEAKDRESAIKAYQEIWSQGKFTQGVLKDTKWNIQSIWMPKPAKK